MTNSEKRELTTRREQADYIVERLTEFGVRINPSSRIGTAQRVLRRPDIIEHDDSDYEIALESIRDNYQLRLIVDTMDAHHGSKAFNEALHFLRKDLVLPQEELKDTPGRNYQFQLYFAALCTNAGVTTRHEEPDVTCDIEGVTFGIAAKRLRTMDSLETNVKEAANQISRTAFPGIIALDLTAAGNPTNRRVTSTIESQLYSYLSDARLRDLFKKHGGRIRNLVEGIASSDWGHFGDNVAAVLQRCCFEPSRVQRTIPTWLRSKDARTDIASSSGFTAKNSAAPSGPQTKLRPRQHWLESRTVFAGLSWEFSRRRMGRMSSDFCFQTGELKTLDSHPGGPHTFALPQKKHFRDGKIGLSQPLTPRQIHRRFHVALTGTKWKHLRGWHVFRHSFCSNCAARGIDQRTINAWVGHQTEDMVRRYRHMVPSQEQEAIKHVFG